MERPSLSIVNYDPSDFGWNMRKFLQKSLSAPELLTIQNREIQLQSQIAEGGFGFVYLAKEVRTGQTFALKRMNVQTKEALDVIKKEIDILKMFPGNSHIINYYGHCSKKLPNGATEVNVLLEFCEGGHLASILARRPTGLPENQIWKIFGQVCQAVSVLHSSNPPVTHRDLKPENVLFTSSGKLKLCDFGSCMRGNIKVADASARMNVEDEISRVTTPGYRAPEMVDLYLGHSIGTPADIWALGCFLYRLMYLEGPWEKDGDSSLAILNGNAVFPPSAYSETLIQLIRRMLALNPTDRPSIHDVLGWIANRKIPESPTAGASTGVSASAETHSQAETPPSSWSDLVSLPENLVRRHRSGSHRRTASVPVEDPEDAFGVFAGAPAPHAPPTDEWSSFFAAAPTPNASSSGQSNGVNGSSGGSDMHQLASTSGSSSAQLDLLSGSPQVPPPPPQTHELPSFGHVAFQKTKDDLMSVYAHNVPSRTSSDPSLVFSYPHQPQPGQHPGMHPQQVGYHPGYPQQMMHPGPSAMNQGPNYWNVPGNRYSSGHIPHIP